MVKNKNEPPSSILDSFSRLFQPSDQYKRLICRDVEFEKQQRRSMRHEIARSKSGVWGPTHSQDSEEKSTEDESLSVDGRNINISVKNIGTPEASNPQTPPQAPQTPNPPKVPPKNLLEGFLSCASDAWNDYLNATADGSMCAPCKQCRGDSGDSALNQEPSPNSNSKTPDKASSPQGYHPNDNNATIYEHQRQTSSLPSDIARRTLGQSPDMSKAKSNTKSVYDDESARVAAKNMAIAADKNATPGKFNHPSNSVMTPGKSTGRLGQNGKESPLVAAQNMPHNHSQRQHKRDPPPFNHVTVDHKSDFSRSISELTMRSSFGEVTDKISDSRRMAYYAVGKNHNGSGSSSVKKSPNGGGNRRCYFTGDLIRGGQPFYAGSVQQGLRTLVVFCLPSALGLPRRDDLERLTNVNLNEYMDDDGGGEKDVTCMKKSLSNLSRHSGKSRKSHKSGLSRMSSIWSDGAAMESFYTEWTEDEHGNLCDMIKPEWLLQALPEPNKDLMDEIERRFPDQFATLPKQVRSHQCWRLYMKFCFFSGLPIADGEMYYKVLDKITGKLGRKLYKAGIDEIILSHEVMEAVNGQSAEILRLPNKKTFRYLQKHYTQQCAKLSNRVFDRTSWEMVMPEV